MLFFHYTNLRLAEYSVTYRQRDCVRDISRYTGEEYKNIRDCLYSTVGWTQVALRCVPCLTAMLQLRDYCCSYVACTHLALRCVPYVTAMRHIYVTITISILFMLQSQLPCKFPLRSLQSVFSERLPTLSSQFCLSVTNFQLNAQFCLSVTNLHLNAHFCSGTKPRSSH